MANLMRPITDALTLFTEVQQNPTHDVRVSSGTRIAPPHWIHAACVIVVNGYIHFEVKDALRQGYALGTTRLKIGEHMAPRNARCIACRSPMTEHSPLLETQP